MHKTRGWTGLRTTVLALALSVGAASMGWAAPVDSESINSFMEYSTSGQIGSEGVTGTPVISFNSVASASFTAPSSFSLGEFLVAALPPGAETIYENTPFSISYLIQSVDGAEPEINETPIVLKGRLNGRIRGASQSDVVATFDEIEDLKAPSPTESALTFRTGDFENFLNVLDRQLSLVPSTTNGGRTTGQARIIVTQVPEPTTVAVFLTALVGLGLRRRLHRAA